MGLAMVVERVYTHYTQDPTVMTFRASSVVVIAERICFKLRNCDYDTVDTIIKMIIHGSGVHTKQIKIHIFAVATKLEKSSCALAII